jgi:thiosulfate/3-mercaptopyruvate sulfurtransferase
MRAVNVRKSDIIVVYDKVGMLSAPRAYWLFKSFGLSDVLILNGTFSKWIAENRAVESGDNEAAWRRLRESVSTDAETFTFDQ